MSGVDRGVVQLATCEPLYRDLRKTMQLPFFVLNTGGTDFSYRRGQLVELASDMEVATLGDHKVMVALVSHLNEFYQREKYLEPIVRFRPLTLIRTLSYGRALPRSVGEYKRLAKALIRLASTHITTDVMLDETNPAQQCFRWLDAVYIPEQYSGGVFSNSALASGFWEVRVPSWILRAITSEKSGLLAIHPDYFSLRSPIAQGLYRIARSSYNSNKKYWSWKLETVHDRLASRMRVAKFREKLLAILRLGGIPEYEVLLLTDGPNARLHITLDTSKPMRPVRGQYDPVRGYAHIDGAVRGGS